MASKFCVTLSFAKDNSDKATVAFVIANAALGSEKDTLVFLTVEGVRLAQQGYADEIHEPGFAPLKDLIANFVGGGGKIFVCAPCFKRRQLDEKALIPGAMVVGGAKLVEFVSDGAATVSF